MRAFFSSILILYLTGLSTFIPVNLGISTSYFGVILICINILFIFTSKKHLNEFIRNWYLLLFLFIFLVFPLLWLPFSIEVRIKKAGILASQTTIFIASYFFILRYGWETFRSLVKGSLCITLLGIILSVFFFDEFLSLSSFVNSDKMAAGARAYGFFLQPNQTSRALILLSFLFLIKNDNFNNVNLIFFFTLTFSFSLLTGSRAGIMLIFAVNTIGFSSLIGNNKPKFGTLYISKRLYKTLLLCFLMTLIVIGLKFLGDNIYSLYGPGTRNIVTRIASISGLETDVFYHAAAERLGSSKPLIEQIYKKPVIGHGFGMEQTFYSQSNYKVSNHIFFIGRIYEYGFIYFFLFIFLLISLFFVPGRPLAEKIYKIRFVTIFLIIFFGIGLTYSSLLEFRPFLVVWGSLLGLISLQDKNRKFGCST
jgi:hypothetical protein